MAGRQVSQSRLSTSAQRQIGVGDGEGAVRDRGPGQSDLVGGEVIRRAVEEGVGRLGRGVDEVGGAEPVAQHRVEIAEQHRQLEAPVGAGCLPHRGLVEHGVEEEGSAVVAVVIRGPDNGWRHSLEEVSDLHR